MRKKKDELLLTRADILIYQERLCEYLGQFFGFSGHNLYFPADPGQCIFLPGEKRLILPLRRNGEYLGALMLDKTRNREVRKALPLMEKITAICLDNLAWERFSSMDARTGLFCEEFLFSHMEEKVESFHREIMNDKAAALYKICFGMIVIRWEDAARVAREFDCRFRDRIFRSLAAALVDLSPAEAMAAPSGFYGGKHEFCILFPAQSRAACFKLAEHLLAGLGELSFRDEISGKVMRPELVAGHALYPHDLIGDELRMPVLEQALRLRARADYAARVARGMPDRIMAFARILARGGKVLDLPAHGLARINLGVAANARTGQIFAVHRDGMPICQIKICEARGTDSLAEIVFTEVAEHSPEPGDQLRLLHAVADEGEAGEKGGSRDDGLLSHSACMDAVAKACHESGNFSVGIVKPLEAGRHLSRSELAALLADCDKNRPRVCGHYGGHGLLAFHAQSVEEARPFYENIMILAKERGLELAAGLFSWPYLDFSKGESETCALKALEYGRLLPEPHIGILDSLALNISADRKFSEGDSYGAIEEYKLALLANPHNAMARNSLGVTLAALGKLDEALRVLQEALADSKESGLCSRIFYNLGVVLQKKGDMVRAGQAYRQCLRKDARHFYAWIRFAHIRETEGKNRAAASLYRYAVKIAGDEQSRSIAERGIARVRAGGGQSGEASGLLHDALLRNPDDAASMVLLAGIYLEKEKDPRTAEMLARKSAALGNMEAWEVLGRALAAQGRNAEAEEAAARGKKEGDK